jgi:hypothetical protein
MTPAVILAILQGLLGAAPEILALFQQATAGSQVSATQINSVLSKYGIDRAVFAAAIAQAEAAKGIGQNAGSAGATTGQLNNQGQPTQPKPLT